MSSPTGKPEESTKPNPPAVPKEAEREIADRPPAPALANAAASAPTASPSAARAPAPDLSGVPAANPKDSAPPAASSPKPISTPSSAAPKAVATAVNPPSATSPQPADVPLRCIPPAVRLTSPSAAEASHAARQPSASQGPDNVAKLATAQASSLRASTGGRPVVQHLSSDPPRRATEKTIVDVDKALKKIDRDVGIDVGLKEAPLAQFFEGPSAAAGARLAKSAKPDAFLRSMQHDSNSDDDNDDGDNEAVDIDIAPVMAILDEEANVAPPQRRSLSLPKEPTRSRKPAPNRRQLIEPTTGWPVDFLVVPNEDHAADVIMWDEIQLPNIKDRGMYVVKIPMSFMGWKSDELTPVPGILRDSMKVVSFILLNSLRVLSQFNFPNRVVRTWFCFKRKQPEKSQGPSSTAT